MKKIFNSWGRINFYKNKVIEDFSQSGFEKITIFGNGRSYGDVCLHNKNEIFISKYKRILNFDEKNGIILVEAGITFDELLRFCVPKGWFLPVTPGTKFVTIGGAIANDIHGKNHHKVGSFGNFVKKINLIRSDKVNYTLTSEVNRELYNATISGLGLTGYIKSAEIELKKINNEKILQQTVKFQNIDHYFEIEKKFQESQYTVAWIDCMSRNNKQGRGIFIAGDHVKETSNRMRFEPKFKINIPFSMPKFILRNFNVRIFNELYWFFNKEESKITSLENFFYPLDKIKNWNRIYGNKGFYQFQCILPKDNCRRGFKKILNKIKIAKQGSFLAVLKTHKKETSPGINTFCLEGSSLALDFQNKGEKTIKLLKELENIVVQEDGKLYPAKDSLMSPDNYKKFYPNWKELHKLKDPMLTSLFWERVSK